MKIRFHPYACAVLASCTFAIGGAPAAFAEQQTVTTWEVDMQGRPPYERRRVVLPVVDAASVSAERGQVETERRRVVVFSGKPPFRRQVVELEVVDAAALETVDDGEKRTLFRGRPPFRRH